VAKRPFDDIATQLGLGNSALEALRGHSAAEEFKRLAADCGLGSILEQEREHLRQLNRGLAFAAAEPALRQAQRVIEDMARSPALELAAAPYRQLDEEMRRLRESIALPGQELARRFVEEEQRRALAPAMAAVEAMQPDWDRLLGTASIRNMAAGWQGTNTLQDALRELDTTYEDLVGRVTGSSLWTQLQEQVRGWEQTAAPTWSDAVRLLDTLDWADLVDEVTAGAAARAGTPSVQSTSRPTSASAKRRRRPLTDKELNIRLCLVQMVYAVLLQCFFSYIVPRLEVHFRGLSLPAEETNASAATSRTWATVAIPTALRADADATSPILIELQPGAWIRVLDDQPGWLLVEAETGRSSKITGWIATNAAKRLDEALLEHTIQQLQAVLPVDPQPLVAPAETPVALPAVIADAGPAASQRYAEFFAASIRNRNTRTAYWHACHQFLARCEEAGLTLDAIQPVHVAGYVEHLSQSAAAPTVKQHLAAIRRMFDFLVVGQILPANPAASVRGPKHVVSEGKTPILDADEVRTLFAQFDDTRLIDLRDRAILGAMVYSFARVGAVAKLRVKDYYRQGSRAWFVLDEKGGKQNRVPAHHQVAEYVEQYLARAGIESQRETPLFRSLGRGRGGRAVTERGLRREEIFATVRRRTAAVGLPPEIGCHSFRGTGITNYLKNGGTIETAAKLAGHASTRTTQLYDRRNADVAQAEIERIRF
jgi:site-specific recombinase XerD